MIKLTVSSSYWQQVNSFSAGETKHQVVGSYIRDSRHKCDMFWIISCLENTMHGLYFFIQLQRYDSTLFCNI